MNVPLSWSLKVEDDPKAKGQQDQELVTEMLISTVWIWKRTRICMNSNLTLTLTVLNHVH